MNTDTGVVYPSTAATAAGSDGTVDWTNPNNIKLQDAAYATITTTTNNLRTYRLVASNFGFSVPTTATILGIEIVVRRKASVSSGAVQAYDWNVKINKAGTATGNELGVGTAWGTDPTDAVYGGSTSLLGSTWTPSDINNSGFGVTFGTGVTTDGTSITVSVDSISLKVYYSLPVPVLLTPTISNQTSTSANLTGVVSTDSGYATTARGFCYNTTGTPTTANTVIAGVGTDSQFKGLMSGLTTGTTYYMRAYATNTAGTAYSSEITYTPSDPIQTEYVYKVSRQGIYLGIIPNIKSDFSYAQDINTSFVYINVSAQINTDVAELELEALQDEEGNVLLDEANQPLYPERALDVVGAFNPNALIQENNDLEVYEISTLHPNGKLVFSGYIESWEDDDEGMANFVAVSNSIDMADHIVQGDPYTPDVTQSIQNTSISNGDFTGTMVGQSFTVSSATNLAAIDVKLSNDTANDATVTLSVASSIPTTGFPTTIASSTKVVPANSSATIYRFGFTEIATTASQVLFFYLSTSTSSVTVKVYYSNSNVYSGGAMYTGSGISPFTWSSTAYDIYFITYSSLGATTVVFNNEAPETSLQTVLDAYAAEGGTVTYTSESIDATGITVPQVTFNTETILEGVQKFLRLAPSDFYWYVDPATQVLYFKQTSTTAVHTFIKGLHLEKVRIGATVENVRNKVIFSGGDIGGGVNLFTSDLNQTSIDTQGRIRLERLSDNRVTLQTTAALIMSNFLDRNGYVAYSSPVTIASTTYDVSTINVGDTANLAGFGNYRDYLTLQIARKVPTPDGVEITLGVVLDRQSDKLTEALQQLDQIQTVDNPSAPS